MKKSEISNHLKWIWNCIDQAEFSDEIIEAFSHMPVEWQKRFIGRMIKIGKQRGWTMEPEQDVLEIAEKISRDHT